MTSAGADAADIQASDSDAAMVRATVWACWAGMALADLAALAIGANIILAAAASLAIALAATLALRLEPAMARICAGLGLIGVPVVLTGVFAGHPWQIDTHMLFFAVLAALIALNDVRVIVMAAGVIVVHHLGLSVLVPALIYPGGGAVQGPGGVLVQGVERTLLHGAVVLIEVAALVVAIRIRHRLDRQAAAQLVVTQALSAASDAARQEAERQTVLAEQSRHASETALRETELARTAVEAEIRSRLREQQDATLRSQAEAAEREAIAARQQHVVEVLRRTLKTVDGGSFDCGIAEPFEPEYEDLRTDFNAMLGSVNTILRQAIAHTGTIDTETGAISAAALQLAGRSERQSATMGQTVAAIKDIAVAAENAADRANGARNRSRQAAENAEKGNEIVAAARVTMQEISASSERIFKITSVIDEISFQTNLLALNAGVEAARVGAEGRGFAVVASEVRALAQRSSDAAKDINDLIVESGALIKQGVKRVEEAGQALTSIVEQVRQITADVTEIASFVNDQSKGIGEVSVSMQDLGHISQQIAAMFEETSAATTALESETEELRDLLGRFEIGPDQRQNARHPGPARAARR